MRFSYIAINNIVEQMEQTDSSIKTKRLKIGKVTYSEARLLPDQALLEKLAFFGFSPDPVSLREHCEHAASAEEVAERIQSVPATPEASGLLADWLWFGIGILWERWLPDMPSLEVLDCRMQEGYQEKDPASQARIWLDTWDIFLSLNARIGERPLKEFDEQFRCTQFLRNWVQDLEILLPHAVHCDDSLAPRARAFFERFLALFAHEDALVSSNMRASLASCLGMSGDVPGADALFAGWLREDPQWGLGWADRAALYSHPRRSHPADPLKSEAFLRDGLAVPNVRDREILLDHLLNLCEEHGWKDKENEARRDLARLENAPLLRPPSAAPPAAKPATAPAVGRNDPCPCGSGKKFKKCCAPHRGRGLLGTSTER